MTKGLLKYNVINLAGDLFELSDAQMEDLANKAGLSMNLHKTRFIGEETTDILTYPERNRDINLILHMQKSPAGNFTDSFNKLISTYPGKLIDLCATASVSDRMLRHIKNGKHLKKEPILALLIAMGQDLNSIQRLLKEAGFVLSKSLPNDVVIMWLLENMPLEDKGTSCIYFINETLEALELPLLMTREKRDQSNGNIN